jgi:hypothetical protein
MDCDGQVAAHLVRSLTDLLLEPYLPRRRLGNWARGGIEADESGIQDTERRVSQVAEVEEVAGSDRSPPGECWTRKCLRFVNPSEVCTEKPHALRVAMCTASSQQRQQQKPGLQLVVQIVGPSRLDTERSNLTACNQRQVCP